MDFILPNIGEGIETISVSEILVKKNQKIKANESILLVETDKASMEIPIDIDCTIIDILVNVGDLISPGQKILEISNTNNEDIKEQKKDNTDTLEEKSDDSIPKDEIQNEHVDIPQQSNSISSDKKNKTNSFNDNNGKHASPSVRKVARELNCDINEIHGTGINNRITKEDVLNYSNRGNNNVNNTENSLTNEFLKWGPIEKIELNSIQKTSAKRLHHSWSTIPHVTQFDEVNIDKLDELIQLLKKINKKQESKVSYIPFFIKIVSNILQQLDIFNSSLDTDNKTVIKKHYCNIGFAVDTPKGLVVPVIKNVDNKSVKTITIEFNKLIGKAKNNKLTLDDMSGGCITISSLGNISGRFFTPIINSPEVAILGISKIQTQTIYENNQFIAKKMLPISLSYDHRVINGADAARFTKLFGDIINNLSTLK
tara:strand:- start:3710 stop:4990 length:1281 start_codon:yes stop_codon:yes gene_type:complete